MAVAKRLHRMLRENMNLYRVRSLLLPTFCLLGSRAVRGSDNAALGLPWTTSHVEGQVNHIKTIKRSTYGRADFCPLRARIPQAE